MCIFAPVQGLLGEVGGWGRDPKKCTGRDWGMGSSTIQWNLRPVVKYHLRRGVGFMKFLENGSRPQPPTSQSTSNQSSKPCTVLQYPSRKEGRIILHVTFLIRDISIPHSLHIHFSFVAHSFPIRDTFIPYSRHIHSSFVTLIRGTCIPHSWHIHSSFVTYSFLIHNTFIPHSWHIPYSWLIHAPFVTHSCPIRDTFILHVTHIHNFINL